MGQVEDDVIEMIAEMTEIDRSEITRDLRLVDIGIDESLDVVEFTMHIEETFGVSVTDSKRNLRLSTLGDVIDLIEELVADRDAPKLN